MRVDVTKVLSGKEGSMYVSVLFQAFFRLFIGMGVGVWSIFSGTFSGRMNAEVTKPLSKKPGGLMTMEV